MKKIAELACQGVQGLVPYQPGKPIEALERELGLTHIIKLASNENPLGMSPKVISAIQSTLKTLSLYPDGSGFYLKQALAQKYGVETNQITLGNGSNDILELIARTFVASDNDVIFSQHAFAVYPLVTQAIGAKAIVTAAIDYGHDLTAMLASVTSKTRLIFIANPNNPTGTLLSQESLEAFFKQLPPHVICVLDEAYYEYIAKTQTIDSLTWLKQFPQLIISRTFSKAYGLAGLRVGYCFSSEAIANLLNRVRQPFNNNSLALVAAQAALEDDAFVAQTVANNASGMTQLEAGFKQLQLAWIASAGNFISVNFHRTALPIYQALLQKGVIVRPIEGYAMPTFLRVSIGTEQENALFLNALNDVLQHLS